MTQTWRFAGAALLLAGVSAACERAPTRSPAAPTFSAVTASAVGRYIVVLRDDADPAAIAASYGVQPLFTYQYALKGFSAPMSDAVRDAIAASPAVRWVEPVRELHVFTAQGVAPQAPNTNRACHGRHCPPPPPPPVCDGGGTPDPNNHDSLANLWGIRKVNAPLSNGWNNNPVNVDIAMLDTGADLPNTDLCIHRTVSFDPLEPDAQDHNGHGTHTSGTAAAIDHNGTVVGVSPKARLWVVKVCNVFGICFNDAIVSGIDWVTARADTIDVASMSLGGPGSDQPHAQNDCEAIMNDAMHTAICKSVRAGVTYVVAAGNSGADAAGTVPAAYKEVITVAAADSFETAAGFSNFGPDVDLIAPGVDVTSDAIGGGTATLSGTSMATPHVSGGAVLYIAQQMGLGFARPSPFTVHDVLIARGRAWAGQGGLHPEPFLDVSSF